MPICSWHTVRRQRPNTYQPCLKAGNNQYKGKNRVALCRFSILLSFFVNIYENVANTSAWIGVSYEQAMKSSKEFRLTYAEYLISHALLYNTSIPSQRKVK